MIRRYRQTKIVATLGPASGDPDMMRELFKAGVAVFRLNFSHGSHEAHAQNVKTARALEKEFDVMLDMDDIIEMSSVKIAKEILAKHDVVF